MGIKRIIPRISQYSVEAGLVSERLSAMGPGDQVSYEELNQKSGISVIHRRNILNSARKKLLREEQKVYKTVTGYGLARLTNEEIASIGVETSRKVGKAARRAIQSTSACEYDQLSNTGKTTYTVGMTVLNLIQHSASKNTTKKLESSVTLGVKMLPPETILKSFAG